MREKYSIEVNEDYIEIFGDLTIEETFDFLNFFEKKGFKSVVNGYENSSLRMTKIGQDEIRDNEYISSLKEDIKFYKDLLEKEKSFHAFSKKKLSDVENLLKTLMEESKDKTLTLLKENEKLKKEIKLEELKESPEVRDILNKTEECERFIAKPFSSPLEP